MKHVWYLTGDPDCETAIGFPTFFESKTCAEQYARVVFPYETQWQRDARIRYRPVFTQTDLNGE